MDTSHLDDDALSASLDGALDDGAGRNHLAGCAVCSARRDQLDAARAALASAPVEPVDELTRRRLVATALEAAGVVTRRPAWYQRPALAGGVAAAILALLVAVPFVTGRDSSDSDRSSTAALEMAGGEFLGDLGDLSDPAVLRQRFGNQRALTFSDDTQAGGGANAAPGTGSVTASKGAAPPQAPVAGSPAGEGQTAPGPSPQPAADAAAESSPLTEAARDEADSSGLDRTVADACARTLAEGPARGADLLAVATGSYQGSPAVVAVFSDGAGTTAYVAARDGCRLLTRYEV